MADLMAVLLARFLRYDFDRPERTLNDHLIFSKGHASPLLYALYKAAGAISDEELLSFRKLEPARGPSDRRDPGGRRRDRVAGPGLPCAVGVALSAKRLERLAYRTWVLCGDSEMA
ncbi:MAG: transketolase, partial [Actinobacteria bacterium]|nr:transketolase [Actinomycetota bacterium]